MTDGYVVPEPERPWAFDAATGTWRPTLPDGQPIPAEPGDHPPPPLVDGGAMSVYCYDCSLRHDDQVCETCPRRTSSSFHIAEERSVPSWWRRLLRRGT